MLLVDTNQIVNVMYEGVSEDKRRQHEMRRRIERGSVDAIASIPLPNSRSSLDDGTQSTSRASSLASDDDESSDTDSVSDTNTSPPDNDHNDGPSTSTNANANENENGPPLDLMLPFQNVMNNAGSVDEPVVDIWYDLDMVTEVRDPDGFFEELAELRRYVSLLAIRPVVVLPL